MTINVMLQEALGSISSIDNTLFPFEIRTVEDMRLWYGIYCSFRTGSDSRAVSENVGVLDIQVVNQWSKKEQAKGDKFTERMELHYANQKLLDECF